MNLDVQVEKLSNIARKLTVKVPAQMVSDRFERGIQEVAKTAKLKGFRPGMAPITVVKQMYGADVRHQVFHNLIDETFKTAVRQEKIQPVGTPKIETPDHKTGEGAHDHTLDESKDLTYIATIEVLPEIDVKGYTGVALSRAVTKVTDEDVEGVVKNLLDSQSQLVPASSGLASADGTPSSRPVRMADFVDMQFAGGIVTPTGLDEKPGMKGTRMLEVGSNELIQGFEEHLVGMRAGETKTFRVPFPADFYDKDMAGKEAEFTVTVNEVKEKKAPTLDDEFAKTVGYESVADMKTKARDHLANEKTQESDRRLRSDLLQNLIDKNAFDVPQSLVQAQTRALAQDVAGNLKKQGFSDEMVQEALGGELENLKKRAENQVRASLILEAIAKKEVIEVKPEELAAEMSQMAVTMKVEEAKLREYYTQNPGRIEDLTFRMREDRTVKFLLEKSKIK